MKLKGKISLFSRYERVTDRRTFKDRRELWAAPKKEKEVVVEKPKAKIKHVETPEGNTYQRKPRTKRGEKPAEEAHEEEHHEEEHHEEEAPAEEHEEQQEEQEQHHEE